MKTVRLAAIAVVVASATGCATQGQDLKPVAASELTTPVFRPWKTENPTLKIANEKPLQFAPNATAADKLFAVLGMPSFAQIGPGGVRNAYLQQASPDQVKQAISATARPSAGYNNDGSMIAFNAIGGGVGAAGLALTVLGDNGFDPRTKMGFMFCFEKKSDTSTLEEAGVRCASKLNDVVNATLQPTVRVQKLDFAQVRDGFVKTPTGSKLGEIFIGTKGGYLVDGYAPVDRGGYPARLVAIPFYSEVGSGVGKMIGANLGEVNAADFAAALREHLPKDMAFYLPDGTNPAAAY
jgi:hypothetical protein